MRQAAQRHHVRQQVLQRRVIQQGPWLDAPPTRQHPAHRQNSQPARACTQHTQTADVVNLLGMDVLPGVGHMCHGFIKIIGAAGQRSCVDGTRRGAAQDGERIGAVRLPLLAADCGYGLQHAHLVSRTRATTTQHQGIVCAGLGGYRWSRRHAADSTEPCVKCKSAARQGHGPQG